jgi:hypothetical protein
MNTDDLIKNLLEEVDKNPKQPLGTPEIYIGCLMVILMIYAVCVQNIIGFRGDMTTQFLRPMFVLELVLLLLLSVISAMAAVLSMYPDMYHNKTILKIPYMIFGVFFIFIVLQIINPSVPVNNISKILSEHTYECTLCIASVAIVPAGLIFRLQKMGACIYPFHAGSFAVLTACGVGCFVLRLCEANDSINHLVIWHYIPVFLFSCLGAILGKIFLKW